MGFVWAVAFTWSKSSKYQVGQNQAQSPLLGESLQQYDSWNMCRISFCITAGYFPRKCAVQIKGDNIEVGRLKCNTFCAKEIMKHQIYAYYKWTLFGSQVTHIFGTSTYCRGLDKISKYSCSFSLRTDTTTQHSLTNRHRDICIMCH